MGKTVQQSAESYSRRRSLSDLRPVNVKIDSTKARKRSIGTGWSRDQLIRELDKVDKCSMVGYFSRVAISLFPERADNFAFHLPRIKDTRDHQGLRNSCRFMFVDWAVSDVLAESLKERGHHTDVDLLNKLGGINSTSESTYALRMLRLMQGRHESHTPERSLIDEAGNSIVALRQSGPMLSCSNALLTVAESQSVLGADRAFEMVEQKLDELIGKSLSYG